MSNPTTTPIPFPDDILEALADEAGVATDEIVPLFRLGDHYYAKADAGGADGEVILAMTDSFILFGYYTNIL